MTTHGRTGRFTWLTSHAMGNFPLADCVNSLSRLVNSHSDLICSVHFDGRQWHCVLGTGTRLAPQYSYEDAAINWARELIGPGSDG